jgi:hypothetical protein
MLKYNYDIQNKMPVINDSTQKVYKCFLPLTILSFCLFLIFSGCSSEQEEKHLLEKEKMATVSKIQEESYESNVNTLKALVRSSLLDSTVFPIDERIVFIRIFQKESREILYRLFCKDELSSIHNLPAEEQSVLVPDYSGDS